MPDTDPEAPSAGPPSQDASGPGADSSPADPAGPAPDAGRLEPVPGTGTGLQREVGRMADGRRITYYWARPGAPS